MIVSHTPPAPTCEQLMGSAPRAFAIRVHQAQLALRSVPFIAGHLHRSLHRSWRGDTVLDELGAV